jgi:hypothetical protein
LLAKNYYELTGSHLQVYGDLELYGAITHETAPELRTRVDKIGNHFVEVKTITPFKATTQLRSISSATLARRED